MHQLLSGPGIMQTRGPEFGAPVPTSVPGAQGVDGHRRKLGAHWPASLAKMTSWSFGKKPCLKRSDREVPEEDMLRSWI